MGGIFGGGKSETKVTQTRDIPPPTQEETQLLRSLYNIAQTDYYQPSEYFQNVLMNYYRPSSQLLQVLGEYYKPSEEFKSILSKYYQPSKEFVETMKNPYLSMLPYQEKWGDYLNQMAIRGIINSTIAQNAMKELGQALAERAQELKTATLAQLEEAQRVSLEDQLRRAQLLDQAYKQYLTDRLQRAILEDELQRMSLADQLQRATMLEEAQKLSTDERYRMLFNLWSTLYSGRMGVPTVTSTQTTSGVSPFANVLGQAAGLGVGWWLGPGGGLSAIGSALGSLFAPAATTAATTAAAGSMAAKMAANFGSPFSAALRALFL